jgi:hypothetical protein
MTTPLKRLLGRVAERVAGTWSEGPEPPPRFAEYVTDFANLHPKANRGEWARFATKMAGEAYRTGFQRGYEHVERDPEPGFQRLPPEIVADQEDPEWSNPMRRIVAPDLSNPLDLVDDELPVEVVPRDGGNEST